MESPRVTVRWEGNNTAVVVCRGEFDLDTASVLAQACAGEAASAELLVLDVRGVAFADSTFLNELLRLLQSRPVVLAGPLPGQLRRMLEMTGALALFEVRDDAATA
ncbi:STAS domain-containing protein [Streptomyces sp. NPDC051582]|uniref:STAS domain-containing protein n=1 Tax=Streptomyces sp. NPDC051582 TaxID=3155167 RepID=UPI003429310F